MRAQDPSDHLLESRRAEDLLVWTSLLLPALGLIVAYEGLRGLGSAKQVDALERAESWLFSPGGEFLLPVLAVSAFLAYRNGSRLIASLGSSSSWSLAVGFLVPGTALHFWGTYVSAPFLLMPSLALVILGCAALLGGREAVRALAFPCLLLLLAVPLPAVLVNRIVFPLQLATVKMTSALLAGIGMEVSAQGDLFQTSRHAFHVIESCSGLRAISTLTLAAAAYIGVFDVRGWRAAVLILSGPLFGLVVNEIRVLSIVLNPYSWMSSVHNAQGMLMIAVGVFLIAGLDWQLVRISHKPRRGPASPPRGSAPPSVGRVAAATAIPALLAGFALALEPWSPARSEELSTLRLPTLIREWRSTGTKIDETFLGSVRFSERIALEFNVDGRPIVLFLGTNDRLDPHSSLLSEKTLYPGAGWEILERRPATIPGAPDSAEVALLASGNRRRLVLRWHQGIEPFGVELGRAALALDRGPTRRPGRAMVVRIESPVGGPGGTPGGSISQAEAALGEFLRATAPVLQRYGAL